MGSKEWRQKGKWVRREARVRGGTGTEEGEGTRELEKERSE